MEARTGREPVRGAAVALTVLTLINLFNYLDRYVVSALVESLKHSELHLTDARLGLLVTGFILVYILASPVFGSLGDRKRRPPLIAIGVAIWSLATTLGGFAHGFGALFTARAAVGIGEAAYATIAPALLADFFPPEKRGRAFAVFFSAIPIGSAAGYILGGLIDQHFGWRAAFFIAGAPGLLLAFLVLAVRDPPRGGEDHEEKIAGEDKDHSILHDYADLFRNLPYVLTVAGYAAYTFALGGLAFWTPAFLERVRGVPRSEATVQFGAIVVVTGFAGTFAGGWIADALLRKTRQAYLWLSGGATLLAAPIALVAFAAPQRSIYLPAIIIAELLLFASTGPVNSAIVNVVRSRERATAVALSILAIHLFGDVPSPPLIGAISDRTSLGSAFMIVPLAIAAAGIIWLYEARRESRMAGG
jgi:predicted MFS family arabinose efflux permease